MTPTLENVRVGHLVMCGRTLGAEEYTTGWHKAGSLSANGLFELQVVEKNSRLIAFLSAVRP